MQLRNIIGMVAAPGDRLDRPGFIFLLVADPGQLVPHLIAHEATDIIEEGLFVDRTQHGLVAQTQCLDLPVETILDLLGLHSSGNIPQSGNVIGFSADVGKGGTYFSVKDRSVLPADSHTFEQACLSLPLSPEFLDDGAYALFVVDILNSQPGYLFSRITQHLANLVVAHQEFPGMLVKYQHAVV